MRDNIEEDDFWETQDDSPIVKPSDVFTVNEVRSCRELYDMIRDKTLTTHPKYQRNEVWNNEKQTRFIDSLAKQLPIPSLCISNSNEEYQSIDGQQRLTTIYKFLSDEEWKLSKLDDVDSELSGQTNNEIKKNPLLLNKIRNFMLPVTIIMCDYTKESHLEYIFKIFHRLNSTAEVLNNQEIRNCVYSGSLNDLLNKMGNLEKFVTLKKLNKKALNRLSGSEGVLIFLSFYDNIKNYQGKLTSFLNQYMIKNKNQTVGWIESRENLFVDTLQIMSKIDNLKQSNAMFYPVMYGIAKNINSLKSTNQSTLNNLYSKLEGNDAFSTDELKGGTWTKGKIEKRFELAQKIFCI